MELSADNLQKFFPYYLTEDRKKGLLKALGDIPSRRYFSTISDPEPLQGDGWHGLQVLRFEDGARARIRGIVLTNSCDLAGGNTRLMPPLLNFAPLILLERYLGVLQASGVSEQRIEQHRSDIRAQMISHLFYLPTDGNAGPEQIAVLPDAHTIPMAAFNMDSEKSRLFALSDLGFYLFVFKLSVHFCRLHENIDRSTS